MLGRAGQAVDRLLGRGEDAAAVDAPAGRGIDQAELDGHPVQPRQVHALLLARGQAELAVGVGEFGEPGVGQQRAVAEDLVEDVRLLQVVQLFRGADKGGDREALAGQQLEEGLEGNQRRHLGHAPAGAGAEDPVDLAELGDALMRQAQLFDAVEVLLAGAAFQHLHLPGDQGVPHLVLAVRVVDEAALVRLPSHVLRAFHAGLPLGCCSCLGQGIPPMAQPGEGLATASGQQVAAFS